MILLVLCALSAFILFELTVSMKKKGINVASVNSTMDLHPLEKQGVTNAIKNRAR